MYICGLPGRVAAQRRRKIRRPDTMLRVTFFISFSFQISFSFFLAAGWGLYAQPGRLAQNMISSLHFLRDCFPSCPPQILAAGKGPGDPADAHLPDYAGYQGAWQPKDGALSAAENGRHVSPADAAATASLKMGDDSPH